MELVNVREIFKNTIRYENQQVTIGGWVRSNRNSKNFGFIVVNDGTFFEPIQVVYGDGLENYEEVCKINVGAAVIVKGQLVPMSPWVTSIAMNLTSGYWSAAHAREAPYR